LFSDLTASGQRLSRRQGSPADGARPVPDSGIPRRGGVPCAFGPPAGGAGAHRATLSQRVLL